MNIQKVAPREWRCFHCDQVFTVIGEAQAHFGKSEMDGPACQVSDEELRRMEAELDAYRADDTKLHREIYGLKSEHAAAVRAAEEAGYAKALADVETNKLESGYRALILAALNPENAQLRRGLLDAGAHLVAATSLLRRGGRKAAGSNKMFAQMLLDYDKAVERTATLLKEYPPDNLPQT